MTDDKAIEAAAKAAYIKTKEFAPKRYSDPDVLSRYVPWDDLPDSWRDDFTATISAAIAAADTARAAGFDFEAEAMPERVAFYGVESSLRRAFAAGLAKGEAIAQARFVANSDKFVRDAIAKSAAERAALVEALSNSRDWLDASLMLVRGEGPPNWDGIREAISTADAALALVRKGE